MGDERLKPVKYHLGEFPPTMLDWSRLIPLIVRERRPGPLRRAAHRHAERPCLVVAAGDARSRPLVEDRGYAKRILALLRDDGLLFTLREGSGRRSGIYAFRELLNLAEGRSIL